MSEPAHTVSHILRAEHDCNFPCPCDLHKSLHGGADASHSTSELFLVRFRTRSRSVYIDPLSGGGASVGEVGLKTFQFLADE